MQKKYHVFSAHRVPAKVEATLPDGTKVEAIVDSFEAQLVPDDSASGTIKLVATGAAIAEAEALFVQDAVINATFTAGE